MHFAITPDNSGHFFFITFILFFTVTTSFTFSQQNDYFQQEVNYDISVTLNDMDDELHAFGKIVYINHSPDSLPFLYFHLWPNAYSDNTTALAKQITDLYGKQKLFRDPAMRGYIDSLDFKVNGAGAKWNFLHGNTDICRIDLPEILAPGDSITITTPFHVKIPQGTVSRMGFSRGTYQVSQWYPKPAVYDKDGWHPMPYLDQGEFYSEFGRFDVKITIPSSYVVGASGELQTQSEIEWLGKLSESWAERENRGAPGMMKTLHYKGEHIHDFAWVANKDFFVLKGKVILPSGHEVTTLLMYTRQVHLWMDALDYVNNSIIKFSEWIGDYPYATFTAAQADIGAGAGMEYPGLTVVGTAEDPYSLEEVIVHEVVHSWFYSSIGSDERRYPFMDEGLSTAYQNRYMELVHPGKKLWEVYVKNRRLAKFLGIDDLPVGSMDEIDLLATAGTGLEQPADIPVDEYTSLNYTEIIYNKAGRGFSLLRNYLGDRLFDSIMHDYYVRWGSRHPCPSDLEAVFRQHTDKELSWFFDDFIGTTKRIDYKVMAMSGDRLLVKNCGSMAPPFKISGIKAGSSLFEFWSDGFPGKKWISLPGHDSYSIKINKDHVVPELNYLNNNIRSKGIFRKADPLRLQLLLSITDPGKRSVMAVPLINWNRMDGFMAGLALKNDFHLPHTLEYFVLPFYSFHGRDIKGKGRASVNVYPYNSIIRKAKLSFEGAKFGASGSGDYKLLGTGLDIHFRNNDLRAAGSHSIFGRYLIASDIAVIEEIEDPEMKSFWQAGYSFEKATLVNPFSLHASLESNGSYYKSFAEFRYEYSYYGKGNGLFFRLFTGAMLRDDPGRPFYSFSPSGRSGRELYMFQGDFPDRFAVFPASFWSRQMLITEGALVNPVSDSARYSPWLVSASLTSSLPGKAGMIPVRPFMNLLYRGNGGDRFFYEAGLKAGIWGFFEVYVPLLVSANTTAGPVKDRIRFILNLESLYKLRLR